MHIAIFVNEISLQIDMTLYVISIRDIILFMKWKMLIFIWYVTMVTASNVTKTILQ